MANVVVRLKKVGSNRWQLFLPNGNSISGIRHSGKEDAIEWGRNYISTWMYWVLKVEDPDEMVETDKGEVLDEKTD